MQLSPFSPANRRGITVLALLLIIIAVIIAASGGKTARSRPEGQTQDYGQHKREPKRFAPSAQGAIRARQIGSC